MGSLENERATLKAARQDLDARLSVAAVKIGAKLPVDSWVPGMTTTLFSAKSEL
ncbi:hypothetical protein [Tropicibacter oceani]|uniref:Uncharacterized protein n=1 Tax=Tropicibacter oceani TaxID=3058420 RepID=A0ABY8QPR3_9RHOB|nr:hypothetical protein [Tropicibacter oceani]WGW05928.1 hypothetical protein QF118_19330 [Tropicibacter oceani]